MWPGNLTPQTLILRCRQDESEEEPVGTILHEAAEKPFHSLVPKPLHRNRKLASFPGPARFFHSLVCVRYNTRKWKSGSVYYTECIPNNKNVGRPGDDETNRKLNVVWNLTHK